MSTVNALRFRNTPKLTERFESPKRDDSGMDVDQTFGSYSGSPYHREEGPSRKRERSHLYTLIACWSLPPRNTATELIQQGIMARMVPLPFNPPPSFLARRNTTIMPHSCSTPLSLCRHKLPLCHRSRNMTQTHSDSTWLRSTRCLLPNRLCGPQRSRWRTHITNHHHVGVMDLLLRLQRQSHRMLLSIRPSQLNPLKPP